MNDVGVAREDEERGQEDEGAGGRRGQPERREPGARRAAAGGDPARVALDAPQDRVQVLRGGSGLSVGEVGGSALARERSGVGSELLRGWDAVLCGCCAGAHILGGVDLGVGPAPQTVGCAGGERAGVGRGWLLGAAPGFWLASLELLLDCSQLCLQAFQTGVEGIDAGLALSNAVEFSKILKIKSDIQKMITTCPFLLSIVLRVVGCVR